MTARFPSGDAMHAMHTAMWGYMPGAYCLLYGAVTFNSSQNLYPPPQSQLLATPLMASVAYH